MKPCGIAKFGSVRFVLEKSGKSIGKKKVGGINGVGKNKIAGVIGRRIK